MVRTLRVAHPIGLPPQVRPLRLVHPDNLTPVRSNRTPRNTPERPHQIRRSQRRYNLGAAATDNETPQLPFPNLKDEYDEQENNEFVPSHQERSREREINRMLREYQFVDHEVRERRRVNREKENQYDPENDLPYMGLKRIGYMFEKNAEMQYKNDKNMEKSIELYEMAYEIDPETSAIVDIAVMYETENQYGNATKWYERAVDAGCVVAMFNFADMYENLSKKDYLDASQKNSAYKNMLKYYKMGADLKDNACLARLLVKCYVKVISAPGQTMDELQEYFEIELMLYTYYAEMLKRNSCSCQYLEDCECKCFDINELDDDLGEQDFVIYNEMMDDNTELSVINKCEKIVKSMGHLNYSKVLELDSVIQYLKGREEYSVFRNKIALFTKLNHVVECPICYETKVNIDLRCAHTFCEDCYVKIYTKSCPVCRCPCEKDN